jgi:hypothetical protein
MQNQISDVSSVHACKSLQNSVCRLETELAKAGASARDADEVRREVRFTRRNSGALQVSAAVVLRTQVTTTTLQIGSSPASCTKSLIAFEKHYHNHTSTVCMLLDLR